jgi:hypothetical protein
VPVAEVIVFVDMVSILLKGIEYVGVKVASQCVFS